MEEENLFSTYLSAIKKLKNSPSSLTDKEIEVYDTYNDKVIDILGGNKYVEMFEPLYEGKAETLDESSYENKYLANYVKDIIEPVLTPRSEEELLKIPKVELRSDIYKNREELNLFNIDVIDKLNIPEPQKRNFKIHALEKLRDFIKYESTIRDQLEETPTEDPESSGTILGRAQLFAESLFIKTFIESIGGMGTMLWDFVSSPKKSLKAFTDSYSEIENIYNLNDNEKTQLKIMLENNGDTSPSFIPSIQDIATLGLKGNILKILKDIYNYTNSEYSPNVQKAFEDIVLLKSTHIPETFKLFSYTQDLLDKRKTVHIPNWKFKEEERRKEIQDIYDSDSWFLTKVLKSSAKTTFSDELIYEHAPMLASMALSSLALRGGLRTIPKLRAPISTTEKLPGIKVSFSKTPFKKTTFSPLKMSYADAITAVTLNRLEANLEAHEIYKNNILRAQNARELMALDENVEFVKNYNYAILAGTQPWLRFAKKVDDIVLPAHQKIANRLLYATDSKLPNKKERVVEALKDFGLDFLSEFLEEGYQEVINKIAQRSVDYALEPDEVRNSMSEFSYVMDKISKDTYDIFAAAFTGGFLSFFGSGVMAARLGYELKYSDVYKNPEKTSIYKKFEATFNEKETELKKSYQDLENSLNEKRKELEDLKNSTTKEGIERRNQLQEELKSMQINQSLLDSQIKKFSEEKRAALAQKKDEIKNWQTYGSMFSTASKEELIKRINMGTERAILATEILKSQNMGMTLGSINASAYSKEIKNLINGLFGKGLSSEEFSSRMIYFSEFLNELKLNEGTGFALNSRFAAGLEQLNKMAENIKSKTPESFHSSIDSQKQELMDNMESDIILTNYAFMLFEIGEGPGSDMNKDIRSLIDSSLSKAYGSNSEKYKNLTSLLDKFDLDFTKGASRLSNKGIKREIIKKLELKKENSDDLVYNNLKDISKENLSEIILKNIGLQYAILNARRNEAAKSLKDLLSMEDIKSLSKEEVDELGLNKFISEINNLIKTYDEIKDNLTLESTIDSALRNLNELFNPENSSMLIGNVGNAYSYSLWESIKYESKKFLILIHNLLYLKRGVANGTIQKSPREHAKFIANICFKYDDLKSFILNYFNIETKGEATIDTPEFAILVDTLTVLIEKGKLQDIINVIIDYLSGIVQNLERQSEFFKELEENKVPPQNLEPTQEFTPETEPESEFPKSIPDLPELEVSPPSATKEDFVPPPPASSLSTEPEAPDTTPSSKPPATPQPEMDKRLPKPKKTPPKPKERESKPKDEPRDKKVEEDTEENKTRKGISGKKETQDFITILRNYAISKNPRPINSIVNRITALLTLINNPKARLASILKLINDLIADPAFENTPKEIQDAAKGLLKLYSKEDKKEEKEETTEIDQSEAIKKEASDEESSVEITNEEKYGFGEDYSLYSIEGKDLPEDGIKVQNINGDGHLILKKENYSKAIIRVVRAKADRFSKMLAMFPSVLIGQTSVSIKNLDYRSVIMNIKNGEWRNSLIIILLDEFTRISAMTLDQLKSEFKGNALYVETLIKNYKKSREGVVIETEEDRHIKLKIMEDIFIKETSFLLTSTSKTAYSESSLFVKNVFERFSEAEEKASKRLKITAKLNGKNLEKSTSSTTQTYVIPSFHRQMMFVSPSNVVYYEPSIQEKILVLQFIIGKTYLPNVEVFKHETNLEKEHISGPYQESEETENNKKVYINYDLGANRIKIDKNIEEESDVELSINEKLKKFGEFFAMAIDSGSLALGVYQVGDAVGASTIEVKNTLKRAWGKIIGSPSFQFIGSYISVFVPSKAGDGKINAYAIPSVSPEIIKKGAQQFFNLVWHYNSFAKNQEFETDDKNLKNRLLEEYFKNLTPEEKLAAIQETIEPAYESVNKSGGTTVFFPVAATKKNSTEGTIVAGGKTYVYKQFSVPKGRKESEGIFKLLARKIFREKSRNFFIIQEVSIDPSSGEQTYLDVSIKDLKVIKDEIGNFKFLKHLNDYLQEVIAKHSSVFEQVKKDLKYDIKITDSLTLKDYEFALFSLETPLYQQRNINLILRDSYFGFFHEEGFYSPEPINSFSLYTDDTKTTTYSNSKTYSKGEMNLITAYMLSKTRSRIVFTRVDKETGPEIHASATITSKYIHSPTIPIPRKPGDYVYPEQPQVPRLSEEEIVYKKTIEIDVKTLFDSIQGPIKSEDLILKAMKNPKSKFKEIFDLGNDLSNSSAMNKVPSSLDVIVRIRFPYSILPFSEIADDYIDIYMEDDRTLAIPISENYISNLIGSLGRVDPNTGIPYPKLYVSEINHSNINSQFPKDVAKVISNIAMIANPKTKTIPQRLLPQTNEILKSFSC